MDPTRAFLSAESLQQVPDASQDRFDLTARHFIEPGNSKEPSTEDEDSDTQQFNQEQIDETPVEVQEHLERREEFRTYLMSLPGAELVRFYKRYSAWTGQVTFKDDAAATRAVEVFDAKRFASVRIHQSSGKKNKVKFAGPNLPKVKGTFHMQILFVPTPYLEALQNYKMYQATFVPLC